MTARRDIMAYLIHLLFIGGFVASVRLVVGIHADEYPRRNGRRAAVSKRAKEEEANPALNDNGR